MASFISNCFLCPAGDEEVWMTFSGENVSITMHRVALVSMDVLLDSDRRETFLRNAVQMAQNTKDEPRPALPVSCGKLDGGYRANDHLTISDAHRLLSVLRDETQSRAVHAECEDVMARLSKIVEGT